MSSPLASGIVEPGHYHHSRGQACDSSNGQEQQQRSGTAAMVRNSSNGQKQQQWSGTAATVRNSSNGQEEHHQVTIPDAIRMITSEQINHTMKGGWTLCWLAGIERCIHL